MKEGSPWRKRKRERERKRKRKGTFLTLGEWRKEGGV